MGIDDSTGPPIERTLQRPPRPEPEPAEPVQEPTPIFEAVFREQIGLDTSAHTPAHRASLIATVGTGQRGLDYSSAAIPGAAIRAAGYSYVVRYIDDPTISQRPKHITPQEYADLLAAGVAVWLVFEIATTDMLGGWAAGVANARRARTGANKIGYPPGRLIFMACDRHLDAAQLPTALAYIDGATSVLGNSCLGVYGFSELVDACIATGRGVAWWQCGHAPVAGSRAQIWQRNDNTVTVAGVACDINELLIPMPPDSEAAVPFVDHGEWDAGTNAKHSLACPVGPYFVSHSGFFSLFVGFQDAQVEVIFVGQRQPDGTRQYLPGGYKGPLAFDDRKPFPIPPGTQGITVIFSSATPIGWSLELFS